MIKWMKKTKRIDDMWGEPKGRKLDKANDDGIDRHLKKGISKEFEKTFL